MSTETSTRQRLNELWEKCPECRPQELECGECSWGHQWNISGHWVSEPIAFAIARDAMVRWLVDRVGYFKIVKPLNTDALISAVEAVLEKQDGQ